MTELSKIRNFSIIAHIDHGKSTLADRLLEECDAIEAREMADQILDSMDLERERGITIKARAVQLTYQADDGETYDLNLIDTPGHVDFGYEVSRSLAACEGAVLVVDASQGVEAQTLANTFLATDAGLEVVPVINKIDLPSARPEEVKAEIEDIIGIVAEDAPEISAKNGVNIHAVLEKIVQAIPAPQGDRDAPLQALIFDSQYDSYRGVIVYLRVKEGTLRPGMDIRMMATGATYKVVEVGAMNPLGFTPKDCLGAGEVGYLTASIKTVSDTRVGDTVTGVENPAKTPLPGYRAVQPMVYSGIYPADGAKYQDLRDALEKLKLNDASFVYEPESSIALGFGFRCGFLGLLHMEIIQERLEREYNLDLITTAPNVVYRVTKNNGEVVMVANPLDYPDPMEIQLAEEPYVKASLMAPQEYVGNIMDLCTSRRGEFKNMVYLDANRVEMHYEMPLNEIIYDFFDALKSRTRGYGSLDYVLIGYRPSRLVKLDILLNGDVVDALSFILFADNAYPRARKICEKLKENIPRAQFEIPVQAAIGGKIIARETIKALRKDVLAKCYGGDITRKKKLLEKQKEGKKRMRTFGTVSVPSEAFMAVLKLDED
ncbi:MAG TPA: elongation factor 4 [Candidatus Faecousia intestinigallinarum]|nr:elongation factor 4 [Candidatus Faecousia intestinigallinarum]